MAGLLNGAAAFFSFVSLVFVAIAMASNFWVRFDDRGARETVLNPNTENSEFSGLTLKYGLDYFGLWVGCHRERGFNKISCGYIGASCYSNICWVRNNEEEQCHDDRVVPIDNCAAYQATRAMTIIGTLFLILGASVLVVSIFVNRRKLTMHGALSTLIGGLFIMIAFAVFLGAVFNGNDLGEEASIKWSFILLIVAWPLAFVGGILGLGAGSLESKEERPGYEETE